MTNLLYVGGQQPSALYVGGDEVAQAYLGSTLVWEPATTPTYVNTAIDLGATVLIDGDNDILNNQPLTGTGITVGTGPDGLASLTGGTGVEIPMPALGAPVDGWTCAYVVKVVNAPVFVNTLYGTPLMADNGRELSHRDDGNADHRFDQGQNIGASALNSGVNADGYAFIVARADQTGVQILGSTLDVWWDGVLKVQSTDSVPTPTIHDWSVENVQKIYDPGELELSGIAIWHDRILTDTEIATLAASLPSI